MKKVTKVILFFIICLAALLRIYKLDKVPPSLNWDEAAAGYNAYTIAHWGKDEWGRSFPLVFESFRDDKHPIHIYLTAPLVGFFGLSDFTTRISSAIVGILSVFLIFHLGRIFLKSDLGGLFSALFLAVSPYHLQYSRGLWEANFALSFFMAGLVCFFIGLEKKNWLLPFSFGLFGLSFFSYHSSKVVVPVILFLLLFLYFGELLKIKKMFFFGILVIFLFSVLVFIEPKILGFARVEQTKFSEEDIRKTELFKRTGKPILGLSEIVLDNYKKYFSYKYLFKEGDQSSRASVKVIGEFYKIDLLFIIAGLCIFLWRPTKPLFILLAWLSLAPVSGAISTREPSATRAIFMIGPLLLMAAQGASGLVEVLRKKELMFIGLMAILVLLGQEILNYLFYYYNNYPVKDAIEWQYGMKDIVSFVESKPQYYKVYMDKIRQQPYIFFLFYLKTPLPDFLSTVHYDESESKSYNTVLSFGRYQFGGWDPIESYPTQKIMYVVTPSYYGGLRYRELFMVNKLIKYPNNSDAFYIVSGNEP